MLKLSKQILPHALKRPRLNKYRLFPSKNVHQVRTSATVTCKAEDKQHEKIHGYTVVQVTDVPEFFATATLLRHDRTGTEHLHFARDDTNNVFSVGFRTTPLDSTGVPHILEHIALCGSKKYPLRDPFFKMLNRSLSTFMNAMTASDWTMYPFSTQNKKDYFNLMSVYLDAAFFPNLNEMDFRQEGWRLEHSDVHDQNSEIIFKGVVFNEMKGALSTPDSLYYTHLQNLLLPHHTYGYVSGGAPLHIPNLTWEQLKEFHSLHYHPSNAKFFTYGNFPLEETLQETNKVLNNFEIINPGTEIPDEPKWTEPRYSRITCPPDPLAADPNKQTTVSVSFMLEHMEDPFDNFMLGILSSLLAAGPNSIFYQELIESNIGSDYSPAIGIDTQTRNPTFSVGLQGIHESDEQKVLDIIQQAFKKVVQEGFDENRIESILHRVELAQKHQTSNFGLGLIMALFPSWNQDKDPISLLNFNELVDRFRKTLVENPNFLQDKVKEYFIENTHKLVLVMQPEDNFNEKQEIAEQQLLQQKIESLSDAERNEIFLKGKELESLQNATEDLSSLPNMQVADIDKELKKTDVDSNLIANAQLFTCQQPTNGVTYFRSIVTTSSIPYVIKPYLPLFAHVITKLGAGGRDHRQLAQSIESTTGGLSMSPHVSSHHSDDSVFEQGIIMSSHCLERNIPMMFSLWQDILNEPLMNNPDRLRTLINGYASDLSMSIASSGHMYAMSAAAKCLNPSAQISELFSGLSQVEFMKQIAEKESLDDVIESLIKVAIYMLNANEMRCALNTSEDLVHLALIGLEGMLSSLNVVGYDDEDMIDEFDFKPKAQNLMFEMDFPVNYVSRCIRAATYSHEDHAKLQILARLMSAKFLHREIREKGGAYGSGARSNGGIFAFFSYRDPNTTKTLDAFDASIDWAAHGKFADDDIDEAKLSVFAAVDSPISPANRGMSLFTHGLTDEIRQEHRDRLFATNRNDLIDVANRYLVSGKREQSQAIIGPKNENLMKSGLWKAPIKSQMS